MSIRHTKSKWERRPINQTSQTESAIVRADGPDPLTTDGPLHDWRGRPAFVPEIDRRFTTSFPLACGHRCRATVSSEGELIATRARLAPTACDPCREAAEEAAAFEASIGRLRLHFRVR